MNIRDIIKAILVAGTLVAASSASAKSEIDAFKNIPSHDIPKVELDAVSGDGITQTIITATRNGIINGALAGSMIRQGVVGGVVGGVTMGAATVASLATTAWDAGQYIGFGASCVAAPSQCTRQNLPVPAGMVTRIGAAVVDKSAKAIANIRYK